MKQLYALLLTAGLATSAVAADSYTIDSRHTFPNFGISHLGFSMQGGRFNKTTGKITLDQEARKGSVQASIDTASIDMGLEDWDKHMKAADFFNVEQYPSMSFSAEFPLLDGKPAIVEGQLTLLGVTRPVRLEMTHFHCGIHPMLRKPVCGANFTARIKRSEFGMTKYLPAIGDEVRIGIPVEAFKD